MLSFILRLQCTRTQHFGTYVCMCSSAAIGCLCDCCRYIYTAAEQQSLQARSKICKFHPFCGCSDLSSTDAATTSTAVHTAASHKFKLFAIAPLGCRLRSFALRIYCWQRRQPSHSSHRRVMYCTYIIAYIRTYIVGAYVVHSSKRWCNYPVLSALCSCSQRPARQPAPVALF